MVRKKSHNNEMMSFNLNRVFPALLIVLAGARFVAFYVQRPDETPSLTACCERGNLEVLRYYFEHEHAIGCPWNERTCCSSAAKSGHLEVLKYAHEHGCPWDKATCHEAALDLTS
jgi:hypothetical protein